MKHIANAMRSYLALIVVYLLLIILLPANKQAMRQYNLSAMQYHILIVIVVLPLIIIWLVAFYGSAKLKQYAALIRKTPEGKDFDQVARGSVWLAWSLLIPAIISLCLNAIANVHTGFHGTAVIVNNYANLLMPLVAFTLIGQGARGLSERSKARLDLAQSRLIAVVFLLLGVAYCFFTFNQLHQHSLAASDNPFYLPVWLLIPTLTVPYLYVWFTGILAAYQIVLHGRTVAGVFYRQALQLLAGGLMTVVVTSVGIQYLRSILAKSGHISLSLVLLLINIIYVFMAVGYVLISIGANRLKKIEEI